MIISSETKNDRKIRRIAIISLQGIGDLLLSTPLLKELKNDIPDSRISVITFESNRRILDGNPYLDEVICINKTDTNNPIKMLALICGMRSKKYDLSICVYPSGLRSAFLAYLSGAKERFGQDLAIFRNYKWLFTKQAHLDGIKHAILMNLDFIKLLGFEPGPNKVELILNLKDEDLNAANSFLDANGIHGEEKIILIHAGCSKDTSAYRSWPQDRFAEVAEHLGKMPGVKVIFIGGDDDLEGINRLTDMLEIKPLIAAGVLSILETAALLKKSCLLICNNSAPMHIAAAVGTPTISVFGPTDSRIHRPWGDNHVILQKNFDCCPCYYPFIDNTLNETGMRNCWINKKFTCRNRDYRCIHSVTVGDVLGATEEFLKRCK